MPQRRPVKHTVLAQICTCFDPAAVVEVSASAIAAERKRLIRTIPGLRKPPIPGITRPPEVRLLVNGENHDSRAARAFFLAAAIPVIEQDMRRVRGAAPFALLIDGRRLIGFNEKTVVRRLRNPAR